MADSRLRIPAAKAGTAMLMKSCAQEFGHERIRVNAVAPGAIKTAINQEVWESEEGRRDNDLLDRLAADDRLPLDRAAEAMRLVEERPPGMVRVVVDC